MFVKDVQVQNQVGLHARPATFFIQKANEYKSSIWVEKDERRVNAKSLLGVLSLGIVGGTTQQSGSSTHSGGCLQVFLQNSACWINKSKTKTILFVGIKQNIFPKLCVFNDQKQHFGWKMRANLLIR